jgi:TonB family protein
MAELSSPAAVIEIANAAPQMGKSMLPWVRGTTLARVLDAQRVLARADCPMVRKIIRWLLVFIFTLVANSSLQAQPASPAQSVIAPKAVFTPKPEYRNEWAKRGLTGKGIVLVTIDKQTGKVTGAQMLQSTGNKQLDGSALEAYSRWRFDPSTVAVSQLKIPIEFANRPKPQIASQTPLKPAILYSLLILLGFAVAVMAMRTRRKG